MAKRKAGTWPGYARNGKVFLKRELGDWSAQDHGCYVAVEGGSHAAFASVVTIRWHGVLVDYGFRNGAWHPLIGSPKMLEGSVLYPVEL